MKMPTSLPASRICIGLVIVLLFVYAYKSYFKGRSESSKDEVEEGEKKGILSKFRSGKSNKPKKVEIVEPNKDSGELTETGKEKISRLVEGILKRQIPA